MTKRSWIAATAALVWGGVAVAQVPASAAPAALAAQTSTAQPGYNPPTVIMRTAGQPDRMVRVLKLDDTDTPATVQDVQTGATFSMPSRMVRALMTGTRPAMPAPAAAPAPAPATPVAAEIPADAPLPEPAALPAFQTPPAVDPAPRPAPVSTPAPAPDRPVFQPNRINSSIHPRPTPRADATPLRDVPVVSAVQAVVPTPMPAPTSPPTAVPTVTAVTPSPMAALAAPAPRAETPTPRPEAVTAIVTPPASTSPTVMPTTPTAPMPQATAPAPAPASAPKALPPAPAPTFGTPLQQPQTTSTSLKTVPAQTWQPISAGGSTTAPATGEWQPLPGGATKPAATVEPLKPTATAEPTAAKVTTACQFPSVPETAEPTAAPLPKPLAAVERSAPASATGLAQIEAQVREACQASIYDLCTAVKPAAREAAATRLAEGRYAARPEVKAALLQAAIADPAPSVRAHCIACLMRLGHCEASYLSHLRGVADDGPAIVRTAARAALATAGE